MYFFAKWGINLINRPRDLWKQTNTQMCLSAHPHIIVWNSLLVNSMAVDEELFCNKYMYSEKGILCSAKIAYIVVRD